MVSKVRKRKLARARVEQVITEKGGYSKEVLQSLGVSWPPPKGWKKAIIDGMAQPEHKRAKSHGSKGKKKSAAFYASWEWKKSRYEAIKKYEQRCMCCGWRVGDTEYGYIVVDHIKPRSKFPKLALDVNNLQILCNDCNMGKSNDSVDDWRDMDEQFKSVTGC